MAYKKDGFGNLMLTPEQQAGMIQDAPEVFLPVPNKWGERGATMVRLAKAKPDVLEGALRVAWNTRQQKSVKPQARPKKSSQKNTNQKNTKTTP